MGCEKAELLRLMAFLRYKMFREKPTPRTVEEVRARFEEIAEIIEELSLYDLKRQLGI